MTQKMLYEDLTDFQMADFAYWAFGEDFCSLVSEGQNPSAGFGFAFWNRNNGDILQLRLTDLTDDYIKDALNKMVALYLKEKGLI